jgi:putative thiamine transport system permease protein
VLEYETRAGRTRTIRAIPTLYLPLLVPQIAFLFGLQILSSLLRLDGTFVAVALVHLVFVFPYVLLSLADPWRAWDPRYAHVARALGNGPDAVFWRLRLPMMLRPVLTAGAVGFAVSAGLYLPTLLIGAGRWPTVTTEAVSLASGGDPRAIGATAFTQAVLPFLGFAIAVVVPALAFRNRRLMRAAA